MNVLVGILILFIFRPFFHCCCTYIFFVLDCWGDLRQAVDMGRLDNIFDYSACLAKSLETLAGVGANSSEQVANAEPATAEALAMEAIEKNAAE